MEIQDEVQNIDILIRDDQQGKIPLIEKQKSAPTRQKVSAFKNRVFSLLTLFVEKTKDTSLIIPLLTPELFIQQPDKIRQLFTLLLNRSALSHQQLIKIAESYKNLLLYKGKKDVQKFSDDFAKILKKIQSEDPEAVKAIVEEMLQVFITKRKCKLNSGFFPFLLKRLPNLRSTAAATATKLSKQKDIRSAQQRVLQKLLRSLTKSPNVKHEQQE